MAQESSQEPVTVEARCAKCDQVFPVAERETERAPCPKCGSTARSFSIGAADMIITTDMIASATVTRGLNDTRVAVLFVLIGLAASVGTNAGFAEHSPLLGVAYGLAALVAGVVLLTLIYRWSWLRAKMMATMHLITGK